jgi:pimeloyl-ACP methyl ester carboxylesterase
MSTIILVHGAFHGGWCFEPLVPELAARGIDAVAPDLPLTSLLDDAAAVTEVLDRADGPVTLLGHSYGGAVVTMAGTHPAVERLVYLTAMAPDDGEPASSGPVEIGEEFLAAFRMTPAGLPEVDPARATDIFYPDAEPTAAAAFAALLRPGAVGGADLVERAAWHDKPATYVVCDADPILLPHAQRAIAARIGATVVEMSGDHSPFLARPAELAALLAAAMP